MDLWQGPEVKHPSAGAEGRAGPLALSLSQASLPGLALHRLVVF